MRLAILLLMLLPAVAFAHANPSAWERLNIPDPLNILFFSAIVFGILLLGAVYYRERMGGHAKTMSFALMVISVGFAAVYMAFSTIYLNVSSATGGPVHWHADFEVWACGQEYELAEPMGFDNKIGSPVSHEHNDNRIHIEGVLFELEDASLHEFFESVGGEFTGALLTMPTDDGMKTWRNGDLCSGMPAKWRMFVNGMINEDLDEYIISPYPDVPPGDVIKFVFTEKPAEDINTRQFEVP